MSGRWMWGTAGLMLVCAVAGCGGGDSAPAPTRPATAAVSTTAVVDPQGPRVERPEGFPNGPETALLAGISTERADWCTRESLANRHPGSRGGVFCDLRETDGVRFYLDLFPTNAAPRAVYTRYRTGRRVPSGVNCGADRPDRRPGEGAWERGRVMCFTYRNAFWLLYTDTRERTLGFVVARDAPPVRAFFRRVVRAGA